MPSPPGPNVYVVVSPNPGKETRVAELLRWVADEVKAHEPWVTMYRCMEANDAQGKLVDYYVVFRLEDMTKLATRRDLAHHKTIGEAIHDEDLLRTPLKYLKLEELGGWVR